MHVVVDSADSVQVDGRYLLPVRSSHARRCSSRLAVAVGLAAPANSAPSGADTMAKGIKVPDSAPTVGLPTFPDPRVPLSRNPPKGNALWAWLSFWSLTRWWAWWCSGWRFSRAIHPEVGLGQAVWRGSIGREGRWMNAHRVGGRDRTPCLCGRDPEPTRTGSRCFGSSPKDPRPQRER